MPIEPVRPEAILFDLDGTLIDSAPDLLAALDHVRAGLGLPPGDHRRLREHVSRGAAGLLEAGLRERAESGPEAAQRLRNELLDYYAQNCWVRSEIFDGVAELLVALEDRGLPLGIVTNKIGRFADPVVDRAGWRGRFDVVVTGDRVAAPKPDPEGVLAACRRLDAAPEHTLFIGDDRRDVMAGRAAGVITIVAAWGYLPDGDDPHAWGADAVIAEPEALLRLPLWGEAA